MKNAVVMTPVAERQALLADAKALVSRGATAGLLQFRTPAQERDAEVLVEKAFRPTAPVHTPENRALARLLRRQGNTYREIAEKLGVPMGSIGRLLAAELQP
jgi:DNA-directed RNA polymerase specialized sigma24 family protein